MNIQEALQIIQETLDSLSNSGMMQEKIAVDQNTVILGKGSPLDSITFVTFITDLEERLSQKTGKDCYFVIDEIGAFDINNPYLSVEAIANYMINLAGK
jgi:acyl carrier protein